MIIYKSIFNTFLKYLPSRFLVVFNSLIIVPILVHMLNAQEVSAFQLSIGILNIICTCSTDWIAKLFLRFYEKYKLENNLDKLFSNTIFIFAFVYSSIIVSYFLSANLLSEKLLISKGILLITVLLVIPAGFRQFLYQMLRVLNKPYLYSISIAVYQLSMLTFFLFLTNYLSNIYAVLLSMAIAIIIIDVYILNKINLQFKINNTPNTEIICELLKYALPLVVTNSIVWAILNLNKFIAQWNGLFDLTAVIAVSYLLVSSVLTPLLSLFMFALFPALIKKFERKSNVKRFLTSSIKMYSVMFFPIVSLFCYFSKEITQIAFNTKYQQAHITIAFFAVGLFFHEMMKLFNIKYHLRNKTYLEMLINLMTGFICILLSYFMILNYGALGAGLSMLISILCLMIFNALIRIDGGNYVQYPNIIKSLTLVIIIGIISYIICNLAFMNTDLQLLYIFKMSVFLFIYYGLILLLNKKILGK